MRSYMTFWYCFIISYDREIGEKANIALVVGGVSGMWWRLFVLGSYCGRWLIRRKR